MGVKVLAIANQKGGVGKTTTALSLAAALALLERRTLVMDLDPHACASVHLRLYPEQMECTAYDLFLAAEGDRPALWDRIIRRPEGASFDVAPGSIRLAELEIDLAGRQGKGMILRHATALIDARYDYILLDCPPHVGVLLVNALVAAHLLIIPIQTDFLALHGLRLLFDTLRTLNRVLPKPIEYRALATMYDRRTAACRRVLALLRQKMGDRLFEAVIDMDTKFREASGQGRVIYDIAPHGRGAIEYSQLAKEILAL